MKKKRNPLSHLGWLGILGVLGLLIAPGLNILTCLLFFFFFTYRNMPADELFWQNVRRAGLRAFAVGTGVGLAWNVVIIIRGFTLTYKGLMFMTMEEYQNAALAARAAPTVTVPSGYYLQSEWIQLGFSWMLLLSLCTFMFTLMYFARREKKYAGEDAPC